MLPSKAQGQPRGASIWLVVKAVLGQLERGDAIEQLSLERQSSGSDG
jgi:hypothetical protein